MDGCPGHPRQGENCIVISDQQSHSSIRQKRNLRDCIEKNFQIQPLPHNLSFCKSQEKTFQENVLACNVTPGLLLLGKRGWVGDCASLSSFWI